MNPALTALITQLTWQAGEVNVQLTTMQTRLSALELEIQDFTRQIEQCSGRHSLIINPELEINRLNFLTRIQVQKAASLDVLKENQVMENRLKERLLRIKTEIKMLEKYLRREAEKHQSGLRKKQDDALDEWVLQKRK